MERERPLLLPFSALVAGLTLAECLGVVMPLWGAAAAFCCLLVSMFIRSQYLFRACTLGFFLVWGMYALTPWKHPAIPANSITKHASGKPVIIEGIIASRPVVKNRDAGVGSSFVLRTEAVVENRRYSATSGRLFVNVESGDAGFSKGDRVRLSTRIRIPHRLGLPGEFDYPAYLAYQGIAATGRVSTADDILLMRGGAEDSLQRRIDLKARQLGDFIRNSIADVEVSSVLGALLLGDQKRIPVHLSDAYSRAGVVHILSISGFHIGIIAFFIVQFTLLIATRSEWFAIRFNLRRLVLLSALPAMFAYLLLTGAAPATVRSVIMLALFVAALYAERESDPINALLLSATLMTLFDPPGIFDVSFQLSFLALWGIVLATPFAIRKADAFRYAWMRMPFLLLVSSCAATLATALPVLFHFNQTSFNGILANFLIVPLLGYGAVLAGFCALPFVFIFPPFADLLLWFAGKIVSISNYLIQKFALMPQLSFHGISSLDFALFLLLLSILTFICSLRRKLLLCAIIPLFALMVHGFNNSGPDGRLHLTMLSVGQAESMLLQLPDGSNMLIDGGGYLHDNGRDFGERILAPALFKLGVRRIDRMLVTHCHPDHIGGLPYIARMLPVGEMLESRTGSGAIYGELRSALAAQGTRIIRVSAGDRLVLPEGVSLELFSPLPENSADKEPDLNEDSMVFRVTHGNTSVLFTSDAGHQTEMFMLEGKLPPKSNILKIGHHGSRHSTSEEFLRRVSPEMALISAGRGNSFGLPAPETLAILEKYGIQTFRTDLHGTIELVSDGHVWNVQTRFKPE